MRINDRSFFTGWCPNSSVKVVNFHKILIKWLIILQVNRFRLTE